MEIAPPAQYPARYPGYYALTPLAALGLVSVGATDAFSSREPVYLLISGKNGT